MDLISTKMEKKKKSTSEVATYEEPQYPYGMEISFNEELISKMPDIMSLDVEDLINISGIARITGIHSDKTQNNKFDRRVTARFEKIGFENKKDLKDMNFSEYKKARGK
ncbi:hypothetical protein KO465_04675 [Candidatus Micrarchaeota archaeon]|jgi:methionine aminopeptidase|nr:hypothetical protein [Candidatus Micrarchaeota archaeon]